MADTPTAEQRAHLYEHGSLECLIPRCSCCPALIGVILEAEAVAEARGFAKGLEAATVHFEEAGKLAAKNADLDKANEVLSRTIADLQSKEGAALADLRTQLVRWKARGKKLVQLARDAQFEVIAKTFHHTALISVMTPEEYAEFKRRIRADNERRKAARALAPKAPPASPEET